MATAANAAVYAELNRTLVAMSAMTDSGDHKRFTLSGQPIWSGRTAPVVRPNGISSGRNLLTPKSGTNSTVSVAAFKAYLGGTEYTVAAQDVAVTRPASNVAKICSLVLDSDGETVVEVAGTPAASGTVFNETRGAAGGPPYIPVGKIEVGQVRYTSSTAAVIQASEIKQVDGVHTERFDSPTWNTPNNIGFGLDAEDETAKYAHLEFTATLDTRHTGGVCKGVYIEVYAPEQTRMGRPVDFKPAEYSTSSSSETFYDGAVASASQSLGNAAVKFLLENGVDDPILREKNQVVTFWFFPDKNRPQYVVTQGILGITRTYPVAAQIYMDCTVTAEYPSADFDA